MVSPKVHRLGKESVPLRRLDTVAPEYLATCKAPFLKIDVQGYEGQVLEGARNVLPLMCGLYIELTYDKEMYAGQEMASTVLARLENAGFVHVASDPGIVIPRTTQMVQVDAICIRRDLLPA